MDAAKPSCPSADPRSLQAAGHVRYSASTSSSRHPGQADQPWSPWARRRALGTGARGRTRPPVCQGTQHQHPASARTVTSKQLWAVHSGSPTLRPPTLPFWAAALPRWASLNSPIAYLDRSTRNPATLPTLFLPPLLRSPCTSYHDRLSKESLLTSLSPADLSSSLPTYSLARPLTSSVHSTSSCSSLPATPLDPPCNGRPATTQTRPVPTIAASHPRHTHPLSKADHPRSFARPPPRAFSFLPLRTQTRTYYSENTEDKARPSP